MFFVEIFFDTVSMFYVICMSDRIINVPLVCTNKHFIIIVCNVGIFTANPASKRLFIVHF